MFASATLDIGLVLLFIVPARLTHRAAVDPPNNISSAQLVWLDERGPGGGGGGGGNQMPLPPKAAEHRGADKVTVTAIPPAPVAPIATVEPDPIQANIPVETLAAAMQDLPGLVLAPSGTLNLSQGAGRGGGSGSGVGTGIGPGQGSGLGPGAGGGTGGDVYRPGSGVTSPTLLHQTKPAYTAEAMRAHLQGTARLRCVVQPNGACTDIEIERSLDRTLGLDQEAIKCVQEWRFRPGLRLGQPVPVLVTIDVEFSLR
jgi:periplasmic protein TonB